MLQVGGERRGALLGQPSPNCLSNGSRTGNSGAFSKLPVMSGTATPSSPDRKGMGMFAEGWGLNLQLGGHGEDGGTS